ncbi:RNA-binding domain-containing protein [Specibacter sp. NPDC078692]|uniref:AlbA family DNA-binding domain-containing protein n=1 Tax=Specibacter sp. NPDC078692 TaxID=3155818 RepID=UPI00343560CD
MAAGVHEEADLDWKQELPGRGSSPETTKDIAAMANSGGGVIVYGVAETSGRADAINEVSIHEADRAILLAAAAAARPIVQGMALVPLASSEGASTGVVVAIVPGSPNAPHLVGEGNRMGVPARNGATTIWLDERAIERAYSERFNLRASRYDLLSTMVDDLKDRLKLSGTTWLVGVATPVAPIRQHNELSLQEVHVMLQGSLRRSLAMTPGSDDLGRALAGISSIPEMMRVGRRRWIADSKYVHEPDSRSDEAHVEVHHDGSLGLAVKTDQSYTSMLFTRPKAPLPKGEYQEMLEWSIEAFAADIVSLTYEAMQKSQNVGPFSIRIEAARDTDKPFVLIGPNRSLMGWTDRSEVGQDLSSRTIPRFHPVESEIRPSDTEEVLIDIARSIAFEIVEQFGVGSLRYLASPAT